MSELHKVGRLAFRHEGRQWNAYWALPTSMEGAIFLGSIPMAAAKGSPAIKDGFISLMRDAVTVLIPEAMWPMAPQPAPENERGGHA